MFSAIRRGDGELKSRLGSQFAQPEQIIERYAIANHEDESIPVAVRADNPIASKVRQHCGKSTVGSELDLCDGNAAQTAVDHPEKLAAPPLVELHFKIGMLSAARHDSTHDAGEWDNTKRRQGSFDTPLIFVSECVEGEDIELVPQAINVALDALDRLALVFGLDLERGVAGFWFGESAVFAKRSD